MLETVLYSYIAIALMFALSIIYGKLFVFRKKEASFVSDYCANIAVFIVLYVILSLIFIAFMPTMFAKFVMVGFALSPFILGLLATYHTEKYFTLLQLCLIATSIWYVWI